tara:strand:- start:937 stop:1284 length:348 start_codon:yes stop_codon:yes gene_type:complete
MSLFSFKVSIYSFDGIAFFAIDDSKIFILAISGALLVAIGLFMFSKRKLQMKLTRIAGLIQIIICIRLFVLFNAFEADLNNTSLLILVFNLIALIKAYRSIKKDDELVRSIDRIR